MNAPMYDEAVVRTLAAAMGRPPDVHDYVITDVATGRVAGIYGTEQLAMAAFNRLMRPGRMYVLTVLHPGTCDCPEMAA
jgi:hypothetical protein